MEVIEINSAAQIWALSQEVAAGENTIGKHYKLTADIELGCCDDKPWHPIGGGIHYSAPPFRGHFDGGGYEISELYIDSDSSHCALFGWLGGQGAIANLTVSGFVKSDNDNTAGIVGYNQGRISECHNRCEVHGRATTGGVAGFSMGIIEKCSNSGRISGADDSTGGIVGSNCGEGVVSSSTNCGTIISSNRYVGGIVGLCEGRTTTSTNSAMVIGDQCVGGVVGKCYKPVEQCANHGSIYSTMRYSDYGKVAGEGSNESCNAEGTLHQIEQWQIIKSPTGRDDEHRWLPLIFKYNPNFHLDKSVHINGERKMCDACGEYISLYTTHAYCALDVECICLACLAKGDAAADLGATFVKYAQTQRVTNPERTRELFERTPGYSSPHGEEWQACCDDYCEFLGEITTEKLEEMGIAEQTLSTLDTEIYGAEAAEDMRQGGFLTGYLFRCLHCKKYHLVADCKE